jgi:hypothetical protein
MLLQLVRAALSVVLGSALEEPIPLLEPKSNNDMAEEEESRQGACLITVTNSRLGLATLRELHTTVRHHHDLLVGSLPSFWTGRLLVVCGCRKGCLGPHRDLQWRHAFFDEAEEIVILVFISELFVVLVLDCFN